MGIIRQLTVRIGADVSGLSSGLSRGVAETRLAATAMATSMNMLGRSIQDAGQRMTLYLTTPLVAVGIAAAKTAGDFEASMLRLQAISGATAMELQRLQAAAQQMGAVTKFSSSDAAEALNFMAMAGLRTADSLAALPRVLELAAAAGTDMASATDIVMNVMAGYRLQVEDLAHVNNVLVYAFNATNTSLEGLAEAMKYAGPIAASAGLQFEEAAAILGMMGNAGIQASMAGTSLRGALSRLLTPTDQITAAMNAAGLELHRNADGGVDMIDMLKQLTPHVNDAGLMMTLFGQRAGPAIAAVVAQGADAVEDLTIRLELNQDAASSVADAYNHGLNGALSSLSSSLESLQLAIGEAGMTKGLTDLANKLADIFRGLSQVNPKLLLTAAAFTAIVASIGPLAVMIGVMVRSFGAIFGVLAGPAGLLIALASFAAGFVIFSRLRAEIQGVERALRATEQPMARLTELTTQYARAVGDARAEIRGLAEEQLRTLRTTVAADEQRAQQAEQRAARSMRNDFGGDIMAVLGVGPSADARSARVQAETSRAQLNAALNALGEAEYAQERAERYNRAYSQYQAARQAADFSTEDWMRRNPRLAHILNEGPGQLGDNPTRSGGAAELDLLDMSNLGGGQGGPVAPSITRGQDLEALRRLAEAGADTTEELDRLREVEDELAASINFGEGATREQITAWQAERDALEMTIDKRIADRDAINRQTQAMKQQSMDLDRTRQNQELLTAAANQGAEAYERMRIALDLIAANPALTMDQAQAMAAGIRKTNIELERATERMQRFSNMARGMGDAFGNAFEQAALHGAKLSEVLKNLANDVAALVFRATVTTPIADAITGMIGGMGGGGKGKSKGGGFLSSLASFGASLFAGGFAEGGFIPPGKWGMTGEQGPEPIFGGRTGVTVRPNNDNGGGTYVDQRQYNFHGSMQELAEFRGAIQKLDGSIESRALGAVDQAQRRGRF